MDQITIGNNDMKDWSKEKVEKMHEIAKGLAAKRTPDQVRKNEEMAQKYLFDDFWNKTRGMTGSQIFDYLRNNYRIEKINFNNGSR